MPGSVEVKQMWSCKDCNLGAPKNLHWAAARLFGWIRENVKMKAELRFTPYHTHFCWHDWEWKPLLKKLSWQIPNALQICPCQNLFILVWGAILFTKTIVVGCIDVYSWCVQSIKCFALNRSQSRLETFATNAIHCSRFQLGGIIKKNYQIIITKYLLSLYQMLGSSSLLLCLAHVWYEQWTLHRYSRSLLWWILLPFQPVELCLDSYWHTILANWLSGLRIYLLSQLNRRVAMEVKLMWEAFYLFWEKQSLVTLDQDQVTLQLSR